MQILLILNALRFYVNKIFKDICIFKYQNSLYVLLILIFCRKTISSPAIYFIEEI